MEAIREFVSNPGFWSLVGVVVFIVWQKWDSIIAFLKGKQAHAQELEREEHESDIAFERELKAKTLRNGEWSKELVDQFLTLLRQSEQERQSATKQLVEQSAASARQVENITQQALDRMKEMVEVVRLQGDRNDARDRQVIRAIEASTAQGGKIEGLLSALWYVLVQGYKAKSPEGARALVEHAEKADAGEEGDG